MQIRGRQSKDVSAIESRALKSPRFQAYKTINKYDNAPPFIVISPHHKRIE